MKENLQITFIWNDNNEWMCVALTKYAVCCIFILDSYPYQILPTRDGYVPVYIRVGDTPLNDINPELAVAFHEVVAVNGRQLKSDDVSKPSL